MHPFTVDLQSVLDSDEAYDYLPLGTWLAGGCGLLAQSLHRLISESELYVVGRLDQGVADHLVVRVPYADEVIYIDYAGVQTERDLLAAMQAECHGKGVQVCSLADVQASGISTDELFWQRDSVAPFCRFLLRELGSIPKERCDPMWGDDLDEFGPSLG